MSVRDQAMREVIKQAVARSISSYMIWGLSLDECAAQGADAAMAEIAALPVQAEPE